MRRLEKNTIIQARTLKGSMTSLGPIKLQVFLPPKIYALLDNLHANNEQLTIFLVDD